MTFKSLEKGVQCLFVCLVLFPSSINAVTTQAAGGVTVAAAAVTVAPGGVTVAAGGVTVAAGGGTVAAGGGTVAAGGVTVAAGGGTVAAANVTVDIGAICEDTKNCPANSQCTDSDLMDGQMRCLCVEGFGVYEVKNGYECGEKIKDVTNKFCRNCTDNEGQCIKTSNGTKCTCLSSRSGDLCEKIHARVSCENNQISVCYAPHDGVDLEKDWSLYSLESKRVPKCNGYMVNTTTSNKNDSFCESGNYLISLSLEPTELVDCNTRMYDDSQSKHFGNQIMVASTNQTLKRYVFVVYCTFQRFAKEKFDGVGVLWPNGNDQGKTVTAKLALSIKNIFGNPLPDGSSILVGDNIKYEVALTTDENYKSFQVMRCTASSSFYMPDKFADTRALISNGCPLKDEATRDSWFWEKVVVADQYVLSTKAVPMFKMGSSEFVHLHCAIKLCLNGFEESCPVLTADDCKSSRRKREASGRYKRQAQPTPPGVVISSLTSSLRVIESNNNNNPSNAGSGAATGTGGSTMFAVIFSVLIAVVLVAVVLGAVFASRLRKKQQQHPERFAMPRIQNTSQKF